MTTNVSKMAEGFKWLNNVDTTFQDVINTMRVIIQSYGTIILTERHISQPLQFNDAMIDISTLVEDNGKFDTYSWMVRNMGTELGSNDGSHNSRFEYHAKDTHVTFKITHKDGLWGIEFSDIFVKE